MDSRHLHNKTYVFAQGSARVNSGRRLLSAVAAGLVITMSGCTLAPSYVRPDAPIPNVYTVEDGRTAENLMPWKEFFTDPTMQRLIGIALENNRDLRIAMLNIEKTRAQYRIQTADLLPTVNAAGNSSAQHLPTDVSGVGSPKVTRQYSASLGFSNYELDLFGRIRSLSDAALETFYSVENEAQSARLSLVAEVAAMYLQTVADRQLHDIAQSTYENRKAGYESVRKRHEAGVASQMDLYQSKTLMEEARTTMAQYKVQAEQDENYLALLLGTSALPQDIPNIRRLEDVVSLPEVPAGMPSNLLERRPDIMAAEHQLKSANANIGAARANFFPTISLTGNLGTMSVEYNKLFEGSQGFWSFAPSITLPIFDTGRNIANLRVADKDKEIAVATYEKTIQTAFREVADALSQRENMTEQMDAQRSLLDATQKSYSLADSRYKVGIDNHLTLLDAQRSLFSAQQSYISVLLLRESNALTLYKTLGGGWY